MLKKKTDEWYRIQQLFKHFNDNMDGIFIAGSTLTIDELEINTMCLG